MRPILPPAKKNNDKIYVPQSTLFSNSVQSSVDLIVDDKSLHIACVQIAEITIRFSYFTFTFHAQQGNGFGWRYIWREGVGVGLVTGFQHITIFSGVEKTNYTHSSEK